MHVCAVVLDVVRLRCGVSGVGEHLGVDALVHDAPQSAAKLHRVVGGHAPQEVGHPAVERRRALPLRPLVGQDDDGPKGPVGASAGLVPAGCDGLWRDEQPGAVLDPRDRVGKPIRRFAPLRRVPGRGACFEHIVPFCCVVGRDVWRPAVDFEAHEVARRGEWELDAPRVVPREGEVHGVVAARVRVHQHAAGVAIPLFVVFVPRHHVARARIELAAGRLAAALAVAAQHAVGGGGRAGDLLPQHGLDVVHG